MPNEAGRTIPSVLAGSLHSDTDIDMFRLDVAGLAGIQIRTSGQTDTAGELFDGNGVLLASDDNSGPDANFAIEKELHPGVYYVAVMGETGGYTVSARLGGARDHGDTPALSTLLKLHTTAELAPVSPWVLLATAGRIYPDTLDTDVFRIDVAQRDTEVRLYTSPSSFRTYGVLTDASGTRIAVDDDGGGGFRLSATVNPGIYYASVTAGEVGAYRILGLGLPRRPGGRPVGAFADILASGGEGPEMVVIPAGSFRMGCLFDHGECHNYELPVHAVDVARFALSRYEVTFAQWDACAAAGGCNDYHPIDRWGRGDRPVIHVHWADAKSYVAWLSEQTGHAYRLPSEAEWEYAARAGTEAKYHWGNEIGVNRANCLGCGSQWDALEPAPVGSFDANAWGLHDMHGNVAEWTEDCWHDSYRGAPTDGSAWISVAGDCSYRPLRGGAWAYAPRRLRAASRDRVTADYSIGYVGFRVARTLVP